MAVSVKTKRQEMPINRDVLKWARKRSQLSLEEAAHSAGVNPARVQEWESGPKVPTVRQARKLAQIYDRPFLEFFAKSRPKLKEPTLVPDFRMHREVESPREKHELTLIQSGAEEVRLNALDLFELLDEEPPEIPSAAYATLSDDAEASAARVRKLVDVPIEEQLALKSSQKDSFVKTLRKKLEARGILVIKNSGLQQLGARGMCIFDTPLPVIVLTNEAPSAQAFTLAHELGGTPPP